MIKPSWKKSKSFRGVRDWPIIVKIGSHGVIEADVAGCYKLSYHVKWFKNGFGKISGLFWQREGIKILWKTATGKEVDAQGERIVDEIIRATNSILKQNAIR